MPPPERAVERHLWRELKEGMSFLWRHKLLRSLCLLLVVVNGVATGIVAILVLYVLEVLHLPEAGFGWLVATYAVGGVAGGVLAPRLSRRIGTFASLLTAMLLVGGGIAAMGLPGHLVTILGFVLAIGFGSTWWNVVTITLRQRLVPKELLGRVTSVYRMVAFCAAPLGAVVAGFIAHRTDLRTPYLLLGLLQVAVTLAFAPVIRAQFRDLHPAPV